MAHLTVDPRNPTTPRDSYTTDPPASNTKRPDLGASPILKRPG